jgi:hypothetical protein
MIMMQPEKKSERKSRTRKDGAQKSIVAMHRLILPCNDGRRLTSLRERLDRFEASVRPLYEESLFNVNGALQLNHTCVGSPRSRIFVGNFRRHCVVVLSLNEQLASTPLLQWHFSGTTFGSNDFALCRH